MKRPMGKRTRPIRGDYFLTIPRIVHAGRILEVKVKVSQVIVTDIGAARLSKKSLGEIERGFIDAEENSSEAKDE